MTSSLAIFQGFYHEYQCSLYIARGGAITIVVNGARRYLVDLRQREFKVLCKLLFSSSREIAPRSCNSNKLCMKNFVME